MKSLAAENEVDYLMMANYLLAKIGSGYFPQGSIMPPVEDFMKVFRVSFTTVVKAMAHMEKAGILRLNSTISKLEVISETPKIDTSLLLDIRRDINELMDVLEFLEISIISDNASPFDSLSIRKKFMEIQIFPPIRRIMMMIDLIRCEFYRKSSNRIGRTLLREIAQQIDFLKMAHAGTMNGKTIESLLQSLEKIVDAITKEDTKKTAELVSEYINWLRNDLLDFYKEYYVLKANF